MQTTSHPSTSSGQSKPQATGLKLYNSLNQKLEQFEPIDPTGPARIYTCGPTVYSFVTIGNWRTYVLSDVLVKSLEYLGYQTKYIMNITDVGHLTGDNLGDADTGEDRLQKAAQSQGKTAWEIAQEYTEDFYQGWQQLQMRQPDNFTKATDHIQEQIDLVKKTEANGFTYVISDGVYFDVAAYEQAGYNYGQLSNLDSIKEGARVEANPEKRDPRDFALWKFSYPNGRDFQAQQDDDKQRRHMEWSSPWGLGFPGWHIECSAMSMKYLGEQFDIHLGGEDLRSTHHPNEIAQAEAATGKRPFVKYWLHGAFLQVDGGRMGKSLGNAYTLHDIIDKNFDPLALRYFYYTAHYRKSLNFTWESLATASQSLHKLRQKLTDVEPNTKVEAEEYRRQFKASLQQDLNLPQALAVVHQVLADDQLSKADRAGLIQEFDQVLSLDLVNNKSAVQLSLEQLPEEIQTLIAQRNQARLAKDYQLADKLRREIANQGYQIEDRAQGEVSITQVANPAIKSH